MTAFLIHLWSLECVCSLLPKPLSTHTLARTMMRFKRLEPKELNIFAPLCVVGLVIESGVIAPFAESLLVSKERKVFVYDQHW